MDYLLIGDVHGYADALEALLAQAGFTNRNGSWRNPTAHAVYVGDLVDRGEQQLRVIETVRRMVDAGTASICLGNHEFNAIGWATQDPEHEGQHYRHRIPKNRSQHSAFLAAVREDSGDHKEVVAWFKTIPMWLEFPNFRAVHACWHVGAQKALMPFLDEANVLTDDGLHAVLRKGTDPYKAAEIILKGVEIRLPEGVSFQDKDGHERHEARIRWWDEEADTYGKAALADLAEGQSLPDDPLPDEARVSYDGRKPVFFGHYWMTGTPHLLSEQKACLDFSIAKNGYLTGYRYTGEPKLDPANLVWLR